MLSEYNHSRDPNSRSCPTRNSSLFDRLPSELIHLILVYLPREWLPSCALTARNLRYPAQSLIFRVLVIRRETVARAASRLRAIFEVRPDLQLAVRIIELVKFYGFHDDDDDSRILTVDLVPLLEGCANTHSLRLNHFAFTPPLRRVVQRLVAGIRTLDVDNGVFRAHLDFWTLLDHGTHLRTLYIAGGIIILEDRPSEDDAALVLSQYRSQQLRSITLASRVPLEHFQTFLISRIPALLRKEWGTLILLWHPGIVLALQHSLLRRLEIDFSSVAGTTVLDTHFLL